MSLRSFETGNLSADNFKKVLDLDRSTLEPALWSDDTGQQIDHNIDVQLLFYWAPKLAKKCESKHWFPCGADGGSYGQVITKFSRMGRLPHFLSYGAPSTSALRARVELRYYLL